MKLRRMQQLCFENELDSFNLLIEFIRKITEKKIDLYCGELDWVITENEFIRWIHHFKSGDPVRLMNQTQKKKFISVIISSLDD